MIFLKILALQCFWFAIILYGSGVNSMALILAALLIVGADYLVFKPAVSLGRYIFLVCLLVLIGYLNDSSLIWMNLIPKESYHLGNLSLWIIFILYYEHIFVKFKKLSPLLIAFIGGVAGAMTYWSAAKLGAIMIVTGKEAHFLLMEFIFWAAFFPLSLKFYLRSGYWNSLLDKSIVFSFDRTGFIRHKKEFNEDLSLKDISHLRILVTGATGGIGAEVAESLSLLNGRVLFTGRNEKKGLSFEKNLPNSKFISLDMANWKDLYEFAKSCEPLDHVVFNAGSMPEKLVVNENGIEFQCASQLLGHYYLLVWLKEFQKIKAGARIVWVSSGGMYLKKLDLETLFKNSNYEKVDTYANVKRAQVTLVEELALMEEWRDFFIYSMHPGWVGTEGLKEALPKFYRLMQNRLRSPKEGADTILWCLLSKVPAQSGGFYFDRKKVSPYITPSYSPTINQRRELVKTLEKLKTH